MRSLHDIVSCERTCSVKKMNSIVFSSLKFIVTPAHRCDPDISVQFPEGCTSDRIDPIMSQHENWTC